MPFGGLFARRRRHVPTAVPLFLSLLLIALGIRDAGLTGGDVRDDFSGRWARIEMTAGGDSIPAAAIHAAFMRSGQNGAARPDDAAQMLRRSYGLAPVMAQTAHPFQSEFVSAPRQLAFAGQIGTQPRAIPEVAVASTETSTDATLTTGSIDREIRPPETEEAGSLVTALVDPSAPATSAPQRGISAFLDNARQFECLATAVYFEARGESVQGQVAVAQVVMNRVNHPEFPNTICGVVYQNQHWRNRCQFSFACDGIRDRIRSREAWDTAQTVARRVLSGEAHIASIADSTHYHATYVRPRWARRMIRLDRIGLHIFYKGRYGGWG